jgi:t-SNARE complex subunit (syntaxin)
MVDERHRQIIELERSMVELNELFSEMPLLLQHSGDTLDRIEFSIDQTQHHVQV